MQGEFEMSMMEELSYFLGLQIKKHRNGTFLSQSKYVVTSKKYLRWRIARKLQHQCQPTTTFMKMREN